MSLFSQKILCHRHNSHRQSTKSIVLYALLPWLQNSFSKKIYLFYLSFKTLNILLKKIFFVDFAFIDNPQKVSLSMLCCHNYILVQVIIYIYVICLLKMPLFSLMILCHGHNIHRQSTKSLILYAMLRP